MTGSIGCRVEPHLRLAGGGERLRDWEDDDEKERERDRERDETEPEETEWDGEREEEPEEERDAERPRRGFAIVPGGGRASVGDLAVLG